MMPACSQGSGRSLEGDWDYGMNSSNRMQKQSGLLQGSRERNWTWVLEGDKEEVLSLSPLRWPARPARPLLQPRFWRVRFGDEGAIRQELEG